MNKESLIYVAGHLGMVGSAIVRNLKQKGYTNIIGKTIDELDLTNQLAVKTFFEKEQPEYVILAAAKVGGIVANNTYRAEFIYENLQIQNNIIHQAHLSGVKKLLFLGSSCIYPKNAPQPLKEEYLLSGLLEYTNEPYAIAKIAGIKMCESYFKQYGSNFISVMPTNLFGPNDNYDLEKSHVLPALIRKMHLAKCLEQNDWTAIREDLKRRPIEGTNERNNEEEITEILNKYGIIFLEPHNRSVIQSPIRSIVINLWGSGKVYREFLYVDDMADACVHIMEHVEAKKLYFDLKQTHINIGTGEDLSISELANLVKEVVGYKGDISWDTTKPDGTPKKQLDVDLLHSLNWKHKVELQEGIKAVYGNYSETVKR